MADEGTSASGSITCATPQMAISARSMRSCAWCRTASAARRLQLSKRKRIVKLAALRAVALPIGGVHPI